MNPAAPSPIARALHAALTDETSDAGCTELTRLVCLGAGINAALIVFFGSPRVTTPLSCVLHQLVTGPEGEGELDHESLALLDHLFSPGINADVARPWRYGSSPCSQGGAWVCSPIFAVLTCWRLSDASLPLADAVCAIVPRLPARDSPLFLPNADDDDDFRADCLEELLRGLEADDASSGHAHARLAPRRPPFGGESERMLDDLLHLGVAFDPDAAPRLRQAAEANEHRGLRTVALASALARHRLPIDLQNTIAGLANRTGPYELRVGRPDAAHQLRAYTHWSHRTPTARRPPTHLLPHIPFLHPRPPRLRPRQAAVARRSRAPSAQ